MFKKILSAMSRREEPPDRSEGLVRLTAWERKYIAESEGHYRCPDCGQGELLQGPEGGCSVNMLCDSCGAKFNLVFFPGTVLGERIGEPKEPRWPTITNERDTTQHAS